MFLKLFRLQFVVLFLTNKLPKVCGSFVEVSLTPKAVLRGSVDYRDATL